MVLLKINSDGCLEANWEEIDQLAKAYDRGLRTEEAYKSKVISLILDQGYDRAIDEMEEVNRRTLLLLSCTAGSA